MGKRLLSLICALILAFGMAIPANLAFANQSETTIAVADTAAPANPNDPVDSSPNPSPNPLLNAGSDAPSTNPDAAAEKTGTEAGSTDADATEPNSEDTSKGSSSISPANPFAPPSSSQDPNLQQSPQAKPITPQDAEAATEAAQDTEIGTQAVQEYVNPGGTGTGTATDPFIIATENQLKYLQTYVAGPTADAGTAAGNENAVWTAGKYWKLSNDITLSNANANWIPIGYNATSSSYARAFRGNFDGDYHTISGLDITTVATTQPQAYWNSWALFGYLGTSQVDGAPATIQNLVVQGSVKPSASKTYVAGVVAYATADTVIKNVGNEVDVTGTTTSTATGGVVGFTEGAVINCYNVGKIVSTRTSVGGVVGVFSNFDGAVLESLSNSGTIQVDFPAGSDNLDPLNSVGGVVGKMQAGTSAVNLVNTGSINLTPANAFLLRPQFGALIGGPASISVSNSYWLDTFPYGAKAFTAVVPGATKLSVDGFKDPAIASMLAPSYASVSNADPQLAWSRAKIGAPIITSHPLAAQYTLTDVADTLTVQAAFDHAQGSPTAFGPADLTYQWYSNASNTTVGATAISGATTPSHTPSTAVPGALYYFCLVGNSNPSLPQDGDPGYIGPYATPSKIARVVVTSDSPVEQPEITVQPTSVNAQYLSAEPAKLNVTAVLSAEDQSTLSYQWYLHNASEAPSIIDGQVTIPDGDIAIAGANFASYQPAAKIGQSIYYCVVTNTIEAVRQSSALSQLATVNILATVAIDSEATLKLFRDTVNNGDDFYGVSVLLKNDIALTAELDAYNNRVAWLPIGFADDIDDHGFRGSFDGSYHTISNLYGNQNGGLFDLLGAGATVQNLVVQGSITGPTNCLVRSIGGIANRADTRANPTENIAAQSIYLENLGNQVNITNTGNGGLLGGGVLGSATATLDDTDTGAVGFPVYVTACYNKGNIFSFAVNPVGLNNVADREKVNNRIGGIVGGGSSTQAVIVDSCYNGKDTSLKSLTGSYANMQLGGILGKMGVVKNSYNASYDVVQVNNAGVAVRMNASLHGSIIGLQSNGLATRLGIMQNNYYLDWGASGAMGGAAAAWYVGANAATYEQMVGADFAALLGSSFATQAADFPCLTWELGRWDGPTITVQPLSGFVVNAETPQQLTILAQTPTDFQTGFDGTLSYQWYKNTVCSINDGSPAPVGTDAAAYQPETPTLTDYYYCKVTNTYGENIQVSTYSDIVSVSKFDAAPVAPSITVQPKNSVAPQGSTVQLSVAAVQGDISGGGIQGTGLAFQWYQNSQNSPVVDGAHLIAGANSASYDAHGLGSLDALSYYYVVVATTFEGGAVVGPSTVSAVAAVQVGPVLTINTPADLLALKNSVNSGANNYSGTIVELGCDIDLSSNLETEHWTPIGTSAEQAFKGTFDGKGHTISGIDIYSNVDNSGLFGYTRDAVFKNLNLVGKIKVDDAQYTGLLSGFGHSITVRNVKANVDIDVSITSLQKNAYVGGLVGYGDCALTTEASDSQSPVSFKDIVTSGNINVDTNYQTARVGGVLGDGNGTVGAAFTYSLRFVLFERVGNEANVTVNYTGTSATGGSFVGGITGGGGNVVSCYNKGNIRSLKGANIAGLFAHEVKSALSPQEGSWSFYNVNCYNTGDVTGYSSVSGIGDCEPAEAGGRGPRQYSMYNVGHIHGEQSVGALGGGVANRSSGPSISYYLENSASLGAGTTLKVYGTAKTAEQLKAPQLVADLQITSSVYAELNAQIALYPSILYLRTNLINNTSGQDAWVYVPDSYPQLAWEQGNGAPLINAQPADVAALPGGTATLSIDAALPASPATAAGGALSYQWYQAPAANTAVRESIALGSAASQTLDLSGLGSGLHYYFCVVTNSWAGGSAYTTSKLVKVNIGTADTAATPTFTTDLSETFYEQNTTTPKALQVAVNTTPPSGIIGNLTYEWYKNSVSTIAGATKVAFAHDSSYAPPVSMAETTYYFCKVTNTVENVKVATADSAIVAANVWNKTLAAPQITLQPVGNVVYALPSPTVTPLTVTANTPASYLVGAGTEGTLSYLWHRTQLLSAPNPLLDPVADGAGNNTASFTPDPLAGVWKYYCVLTNTFDISNPPTTAVKATAVSLPAQISFSSAQFALPPVIDQDASILADVSYKQDEAPAALSVVASTSQENSTLSYQWYLNYSGIIPTAGPERDAQAIVGATNSSYTPAANREMTAKYYYCVVTNAFESPDKTAQTTTRLIELETRPYKQIYDAADMADFAAEVGTGWATLGKLTVTLEADIDLATNPTTVNWTPISFAGTFDGKGHTINNLNVNLNIPTTAGTGYSCGLFGQTYSGNTDRGTFKNFVVKGKVTYHPGNTTLGGSIGGVIGIGAASVTNVGSEVDVDVVSSSNNVKIGGIIGDGANCLITGCYSKGQIRLSGNTSTAATTVDSTGVFVGGIIGNASGATIDSCYNSGDITGAGATGGIAGRLNNTTTSSSVNVLKMGNCYNAGKITYLTNPQNVDSNAGSLIGHIGTNYSSVNLVAKNYYLKGTNSFISTQALGSLPYDKAYPGGTATNPAGASVAISGQSGVFPAYLSSAATESAAAVYATPHDKAVLVDAIQLSDQELALVTAEGSLFRVGNLYPRLYWEPATGSPIFVENPQSAQYDSGTTFEPMTVEVNIPAGDKPFANSLGINFQWFRSTTLNMTEKVEVLEGITSTATTSSLVPIDQPGLSYYQCVATNTWYQDGEVVSSSNGSAIATIDVQSATGAAMPTWVTQPLSAVYTQQAAAAALVAAASVSGEGAGEISYRWYESYDNIISPETDSLIMSGLWPLTEPVFSPSTNQATGHHYYYCVATNTFEGIKTASLASDVADIDIQPFRIGSAAELLQFSKDVNRRFGYATNATIAPYSVELTADINLSTVCGPGLANWIPIGESGQFNGTFDGKGHKVSGFYIDTAQPFDVSLPIPSSGYLPTYGSLGFFGRASHDMTVQNLVVEGQIYLNKAPLLVSPQSGFRYDAGLVANLDNSSKTTLLNLGSEIDITVTAKTSDVVFGCFGGIVGGFNAGASFNVANCYNKGDISANVGTIGGIVGGCTSTTSVNNMSNIIGSCYNLGSLTDTNASPLNPEGRLVGGIIGNLYNVQPSTVIKNCFNAGAMSVSNAQLSQAGRSGGIALLVGTINPENIASWTGNYFATDNYTNTYGSATAVVGNAVTTADLKLPGFVSQINNAGSSFVSVPGNYPQLYWEDGTAVIHQLGIDEIANPVYNGLGQTPSLVVRANGGAALIAGTDYTATYSANINVGLAKVAVAGIGDYSGYLSTTRNFFIDKAPLSVTAGDKSKAIGSLDPSLTYAVDGAAAGELVTAVVWRKSGEAFGTYPIYIGNATVMRGTVSTIANYNITYVPGTFTITALDKSDLIAAKTAADLADSGYTVSTVAGKDVSSASLWVTPTAADAFSSALSFAQTVLDNVNATQGLITQATTELTAATAAFNLAKLPGKSELAGALSAAGSAKTAAAVAVSAAAVPDGAIWVTQASLNLLQAAIGVAEPLLENLAINATQINDAATSLQSATDAFTSTYRYGKQGLNAALSAVTAAKAGTLSSADGLEVLPTVKWVTPAELAAYDTAINAAQQVFDNALATAAQISAATSALSGATATFNSAKKDGLLASEAERAALAQAVANAEDAREGVVSSVDGRDVSYDDYWVSPAALAAFDSAVSAARAVLDNPASTISQITQAVVDTEAAIKALNAAKKNGTKKDDFTSFDAAEVPASIATRYDTMADIVIGGKVFTKENTNTVVLANGDNFPDALAASGFAGLHKAPIVLTAAKQKELSRQTLDVLTQLEPTTVYIMGSADSITAAAATQVSKLPSVTTVKRLGGTNRYDTALKIYQEGKTAPTKWNTTAIIANADGDNAFADALSISPYAYAEGAPIFLSSKDNGGLNAAAQAELKAGGFTRVLLLGSKNSVPALVETQLSKLGLTNIVRLAGNVNNNYGDNRYGTSSAIVHFAVADSAKLNYNHIVCATGEKYADALAGGAYAGTIGTAMLLVNDNSASVDNVIKAKKDQIFHVNILGNNKAVSDKLRVKIKAAYSS